MWLWSTSRDCVAIFRGGVFAGSTVRVRDFWERHVTRETKSAWLCCVVEILSAWKGLGMNSVLVRGGKSFLIPASRVQQRCGGGGSLCRATRALSSCKTQTPAPPAAAAPGSVGYHDVGRQQGAARDRKGGGGSGGPAGGRALHNAAAAAKEPEEVRSSDMQVLWCNPDGEFAGTCCVCPCPT